MYALPLFAVALLAGHAAANEHALKVRSTILFDRATNTAGIDPDSIPEQCKSDCADAINSVQTCSVNDVGCLCSDKTHNGLGSCLQCAVGLVPNDTTTFSQAQDSLANYESTCKDAGVDLKSIQLSKPGASGATTIAIASGSVAAAVGLVMAALSL